MVKVNNKTQITMDNFVSRPQNVTKDARVIITIGVVGEDTEDNRDKATAAIPEHRVSSKDNRNEGPEDTGAGARHTGATGESEGQDNSIENRTHGGWMTRTPGQEPVRTQVRVTNPEVVSVGHNDQEKETQGQDAKDLNPKPPGKTKDTGPNVIYGSTDIRYRVPKVSDSLPRTAKGARGTYEQPKCPKASKPNPVATSEKKAKVGLKTPFEGDRTCHQTSVLTLWGGKGGMKGTTPARTMSKAEVNSRIRTPLPREGL